MPSWDLASCALDVERLPACHAPAAASSSRAPARDHVKAPAPRCHVGVGVRACLGGEADAAAAACQRAYIKTPNLQDLRELPREEGVVGGDVGGGGGPNMVGMAGLCEAVVLIGACHAACDFPALWHRIDMRDHPELDRQVNLYKMAQDAIRRVQGQCEAFWAEYAADNDVLHLLGDHFDFPPPAAAAGDATAVQPPAVVDLPELRKSRGGEMWYLCVFYHRLLDYRRPEVESLAELFGGPGAGDAVEWRLLDKHHADSPFHLVRLPGDERLAAQIANRSLLVKGIYELWGHGATYEELEKAIMDYPDERKLPYLTPESSFKIIVDSFGKVISFEEQNAIIKGFTYIPFEGRVDLKKPDHKFFVLETDDYGSQNGLPPVAQKTVFFGREVGAADRHLLPTYQLKSRKYIGPTAMDCEMAFLMANQGLAQPGKLVYDPFVGTGSILVAAAHFGAMTMGADIDIRVVRDGRGPDCNIWSNFEQYKLPEPLCVLRADNNLPPWRPGLKEIFDAIICDPPYGVRAGGRKSGGRKLLKGIIPPYTVPDEKRENHIPSTAPYSLAECVHDLLHLAARMLVIGGRLVFFYPVLRDDDVADVAKFPEHPCFKLVASCEQILSLRYSRVLLTMVKVGAYTEEIEKMGEECHQDFRENHQKWMEEGNLHSAVFSPVEHDGKSKFDKDSKPKYRGKYV